MRSNVSRTEIYLISFRGGVTESVNQKLAEVGGQPGGNTPGFFQKGFNWLLDKGKSLGTGGSTNTAIRKGVHGYKPFAPENQKTTGGILGGLAGTAIGGGIGLMRGIFSPDTTEYEYEEMPQESWDRYSGFSRGRRLIRRSGGNRFGKILGNTLGGMALGAGAGTLLGRVTASKTVPFLQDQANKAFSGSSGVGKFLNKFDTTRPLLHNYADKELEGISLGEIYDRWKGKQPTTPPQGN